MQRDISLIWGGGGGGGGGEGERGEQELGFFVVGEQKSCSA